VLEDFPPDIILCDLIMPVMGGVEFVENLRLQGNKTPVLVISATDKMTDVASMVRLGVEDVILKPITDLNRLREALLSSLYPKLFSSQALEKNDFIKDWDEIKRHPEEAARLLQELQPPVQQVLAHCRINYRQLMMAEHSGLVLDIAALSAKDLGFYCLDITRAKDNGVLAALLLRAIFNGLLREHLSNQDQRLPHMSSLLREINQLFKQAGLEGQFPLLMGYYHAEQKSLILVSAGLHATVNSDGSQIQLSNSVPLGTTDAAYSNQVSQHCDAWQCQVWGAGGRLRLMLSSEEPVSNR